MKHRSATYNQYLFNNVPHAIHRQRPKILYIFTEKIPEVPWSSTLIHMQQIYQAYKGAVLIVLIQSSFQNSGRIGSIFFVFVLELSCSGDCATPSVVKYESISTTKIYFPGSVCL